jgi:hypothetical protein
LEQQQLESNFAPVILQVMIIHLLCHKPAAREATELAARAHALLEFRAGLWARAGA